MRLVENKPGLFLYRDGTTTAEIRLDRRRAWRWSVGTGGRPVAWGRSRTIQEAREIATGILRAARQEEA